MNNLDVLGSIDAALSLVANRDTNPELDQKVYIGSKNTDVQSSLNNNDEESIEYSDNPNTYLSMSKYPPNNGSRVTSINGLMNPLKFRHNLGMFDSVPQIKAKIDPIKFESLRRRNNQSLISDPNDNTNDNTKELESIPEVEESNPIINESTVPSVQHNTTSVQYDDDDNITIILNIPEDSCLEILDTVNIVKNRDEINQGWTVLDVATKATPPGWKDIFRACIPELEHINSSLIKDEDQHGIFYPQKADLFKAFDLCPISNVKVVIIGQDPYHADDHNGYPIAMGMSFSVRKGNPIPSSLNNIYKEISRSLSVQSQEQGSQGWNIPTHGDLTNWALQGVLLLNTCLTVRAHKANSHKSLWLGFISKIIAAINERNPNCIYVMWGREAEKIQPMLTEKNVKLISSHPSGFSAHRGFIGCNHFVEINQQLELQGKRKIDWNLN